MWNSSMEFNETVNQTEFLDTSDCIYEEELNVSANCVTNYLAWHLGPQRLPLKNLIPMTIVNAVMFITGIFGNLSVCCVILRIPSMRSATNYYLFSLAVADLLILLLGLPNDLYVYWQQYPWIFGLGLCKIRALVSEMTSYSSVLTIVAFSMERYLAICHPLYSYTMSGLRRASKIIAVVWALALVAAIPYAVYSKIHFVHHPRTNETIPESAFCTISPTPKLLFECSFLLFFLLPMTIMTILYIRMGLRIRKTSKFGRNSAVHGESTQAQSKRAILKMLAAVVLAFFICWAPFHAQRLLYVIYYDYGWKFATDDVYAQINEKLFYITGCFYYFSSTVNPILYNVLSVKYRNAFKETLCGRRPENSFITNGPRGPHVSTALSTASAFDHNGQLVHTPQNGSRLLGGRCSSPASTHGILIAASDSLGKGYRINNGHLAVCTNDKFRSSFRNYPSKDSPECVERRDLELVELHASKDGGCDMRITANSTGSTGDDVMSSKILNGANGEEICHT